MAQVAKMVEDDGYTHIVDLDEREYNKYNPKDDRKVVLCRIYNGGQKWATWILDGNERFHGHYHDDILEAAKDFRLR